MESLNVQISSSARVLVLVPVPVPNNYHQVTNKINFELCETLHGFFTIKTRMKWCTCIGMVTILNI